MEKALLKRNDLRASQPALVLVMVPLRCYMTFSELTYAFLPSIVSLVK